MGLLRKLKHLKYDVKQEINNAKGPKGTVYFRGEHIPVYTDYANLPDDIKLLRKMEYYYTVNAGIEVTFDESAEIRNTIVRKAYELMKDEAPENRPEWVMDRYLSAFGTEEELGAYRLTKFCEKVEQLYIPKDYQKPEGEKNLVNSGMIPSDLSANAETYAYFEQHLEEIIHAVCTLVEKEKHGTPLIYAGYVMYQDLLKYCTDRNEKKKFGYKVWQKTAEYLDAAHQYYDMLTFYQNDKKYKDKAKRIEDKKVAMIDPLVKEAKINIQLCSEEELLSAWHSTTEAIDVNVKNRQQAEKAHQEQLAQRKVLADNGDVDAQVSLAKDAYYGRNGVPKDTARAFILFSKAEKAGSGAAAYYLGEYYEKGVGHIVKDTQKAEEYYKTAFRSDYVPAIARKAEQERGQGDKQNAIAHYKKVLRFADEAEDTRYIKQAIAYLIFFHAKGDIDENTIALSSLALDYMRLDASMVKKSTRDIAALMEQAANGSLEAVETLEDYYEDYSHGPRLYGTVPASEIYQKDPERAWEMQQIVKVLRLMKIALLLEKAEKEPETYLADLAIAYIEMKNYNKAEKLVAIGLRADLPAMLYVAYYYHKELEYDLPYAMRCLERSAAMGYGSAIYMLEQLQRQEERTREILASAEKERARQAEDTRRNREFDLELLERQIDIMLGGTGASLDEKALSGQLSFADASLLRHYKNKLLNQ